MWTPRSSIQIQRGRNLEWSEYAPLRKSVSLFYVFNLPACRRVWSRISSNLRENLQRLLWTVIWKYHGYWKWWARINREKKCYYWLELVGFRHWEPLYIEIQANECYSKCWMDQDHLSNHRHYQGWGSLCRKLRNCYLGLLQGRKLLQAPLSKQRNMDLWCLYGPEFLHFGDQYQLPF